MRTPRTRPNVGTATIIQALHLISPADCSLRFSRLLDRLAARLRRCADAAAIRFILPQQRYIIISTEEAC